VLVVVPLFICAVGIAQALGDRRLAAFSAALALLCLAAFTSSTWAFPSLPFTKQAALNPIGRFTGALVLAAAGLIPLLLSQPLEARWRRS
jgi:hypothetical protein